MTELTIQQKYRVKDIGYRYNNLFIYSSNFIRYIYPCRKLFSTSVQDSCSDYITYWINFNV